MWVNEDRTLWADRNVDTWQLVVRSADGFDCGNVVAQIVEPGQYLVRYFVVFLADADKHYLLPSDAVRNIEGELLSVYTAECLLSLPTYHHTVTPCLEKSIRAVLADVTN